MRDKAVTEFGPEATTRRRRSPGERSIASRRRLARWARLWAGTFVALGILGATLDCNKGATVQADYSKTPVLFVHGTESNAQSTWPLLIEHLVRLGYPREYLYTPDLIPGGSNTYAAEHLITAFADDLLARAEVAAQRAHYAGPAPKKIDIVAHSMGAVSGRWYAAKLHPERVRIWISISGSNHGTNALCGHPGDGNKRMCPAFATSAEQNPSQVGLNGTPQQPLDETPYGLGLDPAEVPRIDPDELRRIAYFTIRMEPDAWIQPEASALLAGAGGLAVAIPPGAPFEETSPGNYLFHGHATHDAFPLNHHLIQFMGALLAVEEGEGRAPIEHAHLDSPSASKRPTD